MKIVRITCAVIALVLVSLFLSGCTRTIKGPSDELTLSSWGAELTNGNRVSLSFDEEQAEFSAHNDSFDLFVSGIYLIDHERLVISDTATKMNYAFCYHLHGDSVELTFDEGTIILNKDPS